MPYKFNIPTEEEKRIMRGEICPYCGKEPKFVDSKIIYGVSYGMVYLCEDCNAYVGVHKNSTKAKGRLAKANVRKNRMKAHEAFDKLWKSGLMPRHKAYMKLSRYLRTPRDFTHIGMFDSETCLKVVEFAKKQTEKEKARRSSQGLKTIKS
jgi:hypothetical protein